MNPRRITVSLVAGLMLGVGATVLAAETARVAQVEVSFDQCSVNGRLKFKDEKGGCLQNHPVFFKVARSAYWRPNFNLALSLNPAQCPAIHAWSWGTNTSYLSECGRKLQARIGAESAQCGCQPIEDLARNLSKEEFLEFERAYASRLEAGWSKSDISNPTPAPATLPAAAAAAPQVPVPKPEKPQAVGAGAPQPSVVTWTPESPLPEVHRYGLSNRSQEESLIKGQLTDQEIDRLRVLAVQIGKDIYLSGALAETNMGLARRNIVTALRNLDRNMYQTVAAKLGIPPFRALSSASRLIDEGAGDVDLINIFSGLDEEERMRLMSIFPDSFELDHEGYSAKNYKKVEDLGEQKDGPGALVFTKTGEVQRILAKYQY